MYLVGDSFLKREFLKKSKELTGINSRVARMVLEKKTAILEHAVSNMEYLFSRNTDIYLSGDLSTFENMTLKLYDESVADSVDIFFFRSVDGSYQFDASSPFYDTSYLREYMVTNNIYLHKGVRLIQSESAGGTLLAITSTSEAVSHKTGELAGYFYTGIILNNSNDIISEILETASLSEAAFIYGDSIITGSVSRDKNEIINSRYNQSGVTFKDNFLLDCSDILLGNNNVTLKFFQSMPESFIRNISKQYRKMAYLAIFIVTVSTVFLAYLINLITVSSLYRLVDYTKVILSGNTQAVYEDSIISEFNMLADNISSVNENLYETQAFLKNLIHSAESPIAVWDKDGKINIFNHSIERLSGIMSGEITGEHISALYDMFPQITVPVSGTAKSSRFESLVTNQKTKEQKHILWNITDVFTETEYSGTILHGIDITERKNAEQKTELASKVFEHAQDGICIFSSEGYIVSCNSAFMFLTEYCMDELTGESANMFRCEKHNDLFYKKIFRNIIKKVNGVGELWIRKKSGDYTPVILTVSDIKDKNGTVVNFIATGT